MSTIVFTTNTGTPTDNILGIRENYDFATDTYTVDNAVVGLGGNDSIGSTLLPLDLGGQLVSFTITLDGGEGDDAISGSNATDILIGGNGNDSLGGVSGSTMSGGADIDTLSLDSHLSAANLIVNYAAQAGASVVLSDGSTISGFEKFLLQSGAGNDVLDLSGDANALDSNFNGGEGEDTLRVNAATQGSIAFTGGLGSDLFIADLSTLAGAVTFDPIGVGGQLTATGLNVFLSEVERFNITAGSGNDTLNGGSFADVLAGGAGSDTLNGGLGNDTLSGGLGDDTLNGGLGVDTADWSDATGAITFTLSATGGGITADVAGIGVDTLLGIENLIGGSGADHLTGNAAANRLNGGAGADVLAGAGGNDVYIAGAGDTVTEGLNAGYDTVYTALSSFTLSANVEELRYTGAGAIIARGNALSNRLYGGAGNDTFIADGSGADAFGGFNGTDSVDFRLLGGATINFLTNVNGGSAAGDTFNSIERIFGSNTGNDDITGGNRVSIYSGFGGNDTLRGGSAADTLNGGDGADTLTGNAGVDVLDGGGGGDTMTGGLGERDYFLYTETLALGGFGIDSITDFQDGLDLLKISAAVAPNLAAFTITGQGTHDVTLTLDAANIINLHSASNITITAADVVFS